MAGLREELPPFRAMIQGSAGLSEAWRHDTEDLKMGQFGWRCNKQESLYKNHCLIGNWNEERFDINRMKHPKPLPSQVCPQTA